MALWGTRSLGARGLHVRLAADYASRPLGATFTEEEGRIDLIRQSMLLHLGVAAGLGSRTDTWFRLPVAVLQTGDDSQAAPVTSPAAGGLGDLTLGAYHRLSKSPASSAQLGLVGELHLPTGAQDALLSDGGLAARGLLVASLQTGSVTLLANAGAAYRPERTFLQNDFGSQLQYGAGIQWELQGARLQAELLGAAALTGDQALSGSTSPLELWFGGVIPSGAWQLGATLGVGVTQAVGVPSLRGMVLVGRSLTLPAPKIPDPEPTVEGPDGCELHPELCDGVQDQDGDGIQDAFDQCVNEPETWNEVADDDGCPDGISIDGTLLRVPQAVLFAAARSDLAPVHLQVLGLIADFLKEHPEIEAVQIEGHASVDEGSFEGTLILSEQRADRVLQDLVRRGVAPDKLSAVGVGSDQPVDPATPDLNRRVEFRILGM